MKKLISAAAAVLMAVSFTLATTHEAEARHGGRFAAGLALGIAGAAILGSRHYYRPYGYGYYGGPRYYYGGYYPSYGYYYPRRYKHRHWRHRHHHHHRWHRHHHHHH